MFIWTSCLSNLAVQSAVSTCDSEPWQTGGQTGWREAQDEDSQRDFWSIAASKGPCTHCCTFVMHALRMHCDMQHLLCMYSAQMYTGMMAQHGMKLLAQTQTSQLRGSLELHEGHMLIWNWWACAAFACLHVLAAASCNQLTHIGMAFEPRRGQSKDELQWHYCWIDNIFVTYVLPCPTLGMQGRMCLMLGPPGSGKSSLLKILAGKIKDSKLVKVQFVATWPSLVKQKQQQCHDVADCAFPDDTAWSRVSNAEQGADSEPLQSWCLL